MIRIKGVCPLTKFQNLPSEHTFSSVSKLAERNSSHAIKRLWCEKCKWIEIQ